MPLHFQARYAALCLLLLVSITTMCIFFCKRWVAGAVLQVIRGVMPGSLWAKFRTTGLGRGTGGNMWGEHRGRT